jgi:hypothetical protein
VSALQAAIELQYLAPICYPTLMPASARRVVDTETLTFVALGVLVVFPQNATIQDAIHVDPRHLLGRIVDVEHVPITNPEIELTVFRSGTGRTLCRLS